MLASPPSGHQAQAGAPRLNGSAAVPLMGYLVRPILSVGQPAPMVKSMNGVTILGRWELIYRVIHILPVLTVHQLLFVGQVVPLIPL